MKRTTGFLVTLVALISFAFVIPKSETKKITVVIDAGHGGHDHGATFNDHTEKAIVEKITSKIKSQNQNQDVQIHFTRIADEFLSFDERTKFINSVKPDLVISLHVNQLKNSSASGMEIYICKDNVAYEKSNELAGKLNKKFIENNGIKSRGIKEGPFMILKKSEVPSVLVELGFLSNPQDRKYLTDENEQDRIASTILEFISEIK